MKCRVKWIAALLCCALLMGALPALAAEETVTVSLRVEGAAASLAYEPAFAVPAGTSALDAFKALLDAKGLTYTATDARFTAVGAEKDAAFGGWDGWCWCLGNAVQTGSMASYTVTGGETLLLCYADRYGDPMTQLPYLTAARGADGLVTLTVTAQHSDYDADWQLVYTTQPVPNVTVAAGAGHYLTDAAGKAVLSAEDSALSALPVQLAAAAENGLPLVVRLAPDYTLDLSRVLYGAFTDVTADAWYAPSVLGMASRGVVNGFADYTFRPLKGVTRAEAVVMLARLAGADLTAQPRAAFTDVAADDWYAGAVDWAVSVGVANGMGDVFKPGDPISRQDLAVMLVRYTDNILKLTLPADQAAPAFLDAAETAPYAAEAIYRLQKAGVSDGYGDVYKPRAGASRAELCVLLDRLLAL